MKVVLNLWKFMRKVFCFRIGIFLFLGALVLSTAAFAQQNATYVTVTVKAAPLHPVPSSLTAPIKTISPGIHLVFISETKSLRQVWYQVALPDGSKAYINGKNCVKGYGEMPSHASTPPVSVPTPAPTPLPAPGPIEKSTTEYFKRTTFTRAVVTVEVENKTIYAQSDLNSDVLGEVGKGISFEVVQEQEDWYQITFGQGDMPAWITKEGTSKLVTKDTTLTPVGNSGQLSEEKPESKELIIRFKKPKDDQPGLYLEGDFGGTLFSLFGKWKVWADSKIDEVDDSTETYNFKTNTFPAMGLFLGYKDRRYIIGGEFVTQHGYFDVEDYDDHFFYSVYRLGPRVRYYFSMGKWRSFVDASMSYAQSNLVHDSFEGNLAGMDHYLIGAGVGIVYHKLGLIKDFAPDYMEYGFLLRTDFMGTLKKEEIFKSKQMDIKASYGWMPVALYLVFGSKF